jgi:hypothetical protein
MDRLEEFNINGGGDDDLYTIPKELLHNAHHKHHARDKPTGGAPPIENNKRTSNPNERADSISDVSTENGPAMHSPPSAHAPDGTGATGGKSRRGKKCACCKKSPCVCHTGKCKSCGKTGGCECMGGRPPKVNNGKPLGVMGGRARSKSKTRSKSKSKARAKSKGKK